MLKNYFHTALRQFLRNKIFSTINLLGLAIGISASMILFLIVYYEFSYDRFEKDREKIFRVVMETTQDGKSNIGPAVPAPLGAGISAEISSVLNTVPVFQFQGDATTSVSIRDEHNKIVVYKHQDKVVFTNQQYFNLPGYHWVQGSEQQALSQPFGVVLTESRARQYFPQISLAQVVGKNIIYGDSLATTVTGIVKDIKQKTFFTAREFISLPTVMTTSLRGDFMMDVWDDWMSYSQLFVKLNSANAKQNTEASLNTLYARHSAPGPAGKISFHLQSLDDVHFNYESTDHPVVHKPTLLGLLAIAAFLLFLGCVNFINLTTAQGAERAREIGVRKTMGGTRGQLVTQLMSETFFMTLLATILAICFLPFLMTVFKDFIPVGLELSSLGKSSLLVFLCLLILVVSFLAGFYPAIVLSRMNPVSVMKKQVAGSEATGKAWLRKSLTVSQFVIAQVFIIATFMVSRQVNFLLQKDLGFTKEAILSFNLPRGTTPSQRLEMMDEMKSIPAIRKVSLGYVPPATDGPSFTNVTFRNGNLNRQPEVQIRWGDTNFLSLYGIKIVAGRNVRQSDTINEFVINQAYARAMGFQDPQQAIGQSLVFNDRLVPVVGIIQDFHERSLHTSIDPLVFGSFNSRSNTIHVALDPQQAGDRSWTSAIEKMKLAFNKTYPEAEFDYRFYDETIATFYSAEVNASRLLQWATGLAITISCLGLLGLVIYTTSVRTKEIGIRKVLGASVSQIIGLLSKDYLRLVLLAFLIATPIGWWAVNNWLQNFAFKADFNLSIFLLSGVSMFGLAMITLLVQTSRAALANPVKSLRSE